MEKQYESIFGAESKITAAQYLAELICKKVSEQQKVKLGKQFWSAKSQFYNAYWAKRIFVENQAANKLLKVYTFDGIVAAIHSYKSNKIWSMHNKRLPSIIDEEEQKIETEKAIRQNVVINPNTKNKPSISIGKRSKLNKLQD